MTLNWRVLLRLYTMIAAVSFVSLIVFSSLFETTGFAIAVVAVGVVALVSVILGFVIAFVTAEEEPASASPASAEGLMPE